MPKHNELKDWELLVHFTSIDNLMKILITDSIRLSNINLVNDSYEFLDIELGGTKVLDEEDYKRNCDLNDNEYQRMLIAKELAKEIYDYKERLYLACFYNWTIDKNDIYDDYNEINYGMLYMKYENLDVPSMWAHYANQNKGVAIIFDKEKLIELFEKQFSNDHLISRHGDIKYRGALDVNFYINAGYEMEIYDLSDEIKDKSSLIRAKEILLEDLTKNYYLSKHSDWSVEKEYRFLILDKNEKGKNFKLLKGITQAIKGIIFGVKSSDTDIHIIHEIFKLCCVRE